MASASSSAVAAATTAPRAPASPKVTPSPLDILEANVFGPQPKVGATAFERVVRLENELAVKPPPGADLNSRIEALWNEARSAELIGEDCGK